MSYRTPVWQRILAGVGLLASAPVLGTAAIAIKASDPGPVLHRAARAGVRGRPFTMYKLRTMRQHSESQGSITALDDKRIFPAGRLLRKLKLDELPQLANVLRGEMALVGPRPEALNIVRDHYLPWMLETLEVPPGITGPGSLHYIEQERVLPTDPADALNVYIASVLPRKLAHELVYVRSRSLSYELQLIGRTLLGVISRREASSTAARLEAERACGILDVVSSERQVS